MESATYNFRHFIEPEKPYNGVLNINMSSDTHVKFAMYAEHQGTSIDALICDLIDRRLEAVK